MRRPAPKGTAPVAAAVLAAGALLAPAPALADPEFHTQRFALSPVAGSTASGTVIDIHAEGRTVYALERYHLTGVTPGETYTMTLVIYLGSGCSGATLFPAPLRTAQMTANRAGVANGRVVFRVADLPPDVPRRTYLLQWTVLDDEDRPVLQTDCVPVALD